MERDGSRATHQPGIGIGIPCDAVVWHFYAKCCDICKWFGAIRRRIHARIWVRTWTPTSTMLYPSGLTTSHDHPAYCCTSGHWPSSTGRSHQMLLQHPNRARPRTRAKARARAWDSNWDSAVSQWSNVGQAQAAKCFPYAYSCLP